jgi:hypothetical protein
MPSTQGTPVGPAPAHRPALLLRAAPHRLAAASCACQDWTKLEDSGSEGLVDLTYRTGSEPGQPPDAQVIQKQMAIVAWQPGPNRVVEVPSEVRQQHAGATRSCQHQGTHMLPAPTDTRGQGSVAAPSCSVGVGLVQSGPH